MEFDIFGLD